MFHRRTALTVTAGLLALGPAQAQTRLSGRRIVYEVAGYRIQMEFVGEDRLRWTYLAAPTPGETGKSDLEAADRIDLRSDVILMAWTEKSGTHVVDVFDFCGQQGFCQLRDAGRQTLQERGQPQLES